MEPTVSRTLDKAADLIEERGWRTGSGWIIENLPQGSSLEGDGRLCLEGGIQAAAGVQIVAEGGMCPQSIFTPLYECPAYNAVAAYLGGEFAEGRRRAFAWNDAADRTAAEVIEVLRACALIEAAREEQDAAWETYAALVEA